MANRLYLIENRSFADMDTASQAHVETACARIPGARVIRFPTIDALFAGSEFSDGVLVVPIIIPKFENDVLASLRGIERYQPTAAIFGILFLLVAEPESFSPESLADPYWIEAIDKFYDQAVPNGFVVLYQDAPQVQQFQIISSASGLFRDVDSLNELRRLGVALSEIEQRVRQLEGRAEE